MSFTVFVFGTSTFKRTWCGGGVWVDAMLGSYHIDPDPGTDFNEFNPGLGVECWFNGQWGATVGGFRNSLRRPSLTAFFSAGFSNGFDGSPGTV